MSETASPAWVEVGWAATDHALIASWKAEVEARMAAEPHVIGAMSPQPGRQAKAVDAVGAIPGFAVCIRPDAVALLNPPKGLIPMAGWAASALFAAMDDGAAATVENMDGQASESPPLPPKSKRS